MIAFIDEQRATHGVEPICKQLPIAPSTYHLHAARRADAALLPARTKRDEELSKTIRRVHEASFRLYGARKVWRQLRREGIAVARCTVERLMRAMGLQGVVRGKPAKATVQHWATPCPADLVNRRFRSARPNLLWASDFTSVVTWQGFVYVAASGGSATGCFAGGSPRGDRHRRLCAQDRRLAGIADRPCRDRPRYS